jgi:glycosyltransferase involved in cell wall biosynthesis
VRVAYVCSRYPAISHTFVLREVLALRARGIEVETFSIRRADESDVLSDADREALRTTYAILPPRWHRLALAHLRAILLAPGAYVATLRRACSLAPPGLRNRLWRLFYFGESIVLAREAERRGVRHLHAHFANVGADVTLLAAHFGAAAGRGARTWSFTMHGPAEFYDVSLHRLREKVEAASFVACISDFSRSQLMGQSPVAEWDKLHVVHCGLDTALFTPARSGGAEPREPGSLRILNVARLTRVKGHPVLLEAVAQLRAAGRDVRLTIVGEGPERERLAAQARELRIESAVELPGAVGQDRIRDRFAAADAFCVPSFAEGVPVVLMEAMAMGLPVVATRVMGIGELVGDPEHGLLVPPARADLLAGALARLADDPDLRARMGAAGRVKVQAEFEQSDSAERLAELFAEVAGT